MVHGREHRVRVRRQVDARQLRLAVQHRVDEARRLVRVAVVVLAPADGRQQEVDRRHRLAPGRLFARHLQELGVLVDHPVDDRDERLVAREQPVAAGEHVALEPALAVVLGEHLHHATAGLVVRLVGGAERPLEGVLRRLEDLAEAVRRDLVRTHDAEVRLVGVQAEHVAQEPAGRLELAAVGVRVRAHAAVALRAQREDLGLRVAVVEQLLRLVRAQPVLEDLEVAVVGARAHRGHLVRAERTLDLLAVDLLRPRPALGRAQHDHRPARLLRAAAVARRALDRADLRVRGVERGAE